MPDNTLRAGGLASGLDTNLLVEQLTAIQRRPIELLQQRQAAFKIQLSGIGRIKSRLEALETATKDLAKGGILASAVATETTGFKATASGTSPVGTFGVQVDQLARAAKARTGAFVDGNAPITGGTLSFDVRGQVYDVTLTDGMSLFDVTAAINASGAPVSAALISDGTSTFLSVTTADTGHAIGALPDSALTITETSTGSLGTPLGLAITQTAQNALFSVDGLPIERSSNTVSDVITGTTLSLTTTTTAPEDLVLNRDLDQTKANIDAFITAYNSVMELVQGDLDIGAEIDRNKSLGGDPSLRFLQTRLQRLLTTEVAGAGVDIRTLGDIGIKSNRDGSLTLDETTLADAIAKDPTAVRAVFTDATGGISKQVQELVELQTDSVDGVLTNREDGIQSSIDNIDLDIENLELRVEGFKQALIAKFIAMEELISGLNALSGFLAQQKFPGFGGNE